MSKAIAFLSSDSGSSSDSDGVPDFIAGETSGGRPPISFTVTLTEDNLESLVLPPEFAAAIEARFCSGVEDPIRFTKTFSKRDEIILYLPVSFVRDAQLGKRNRVRVRFGKPTHKVYPICMRNRTSNNGLLKKHTELYSNWPDFTGHYGMKSGKTYSFEFVRSGPDTRNYILVKEVV